MPCKTPSIAFGLSPWPSVHSACVSSIYIDTHPLHSFHTTASIPPYTNHHRQRTPEERAGTTPDTILPSLEGQKNSAAHGSAGGQQEGCMGRGGGGGQLAGSDDVGPGCGGGGRCAGGNGIPGGGACGGGGRRGWPGRGCVQAAAGFVRLLVAEVPRRAGRPRLQRIGGAP
ncbi:translation initiation factor IF-2-like isoform X1 [Hordeum vulgare subsp. vulgare]|uniref:translation initiation factor IF-2-like isoform X1 n=1 Tax=Hordeum vulgare subsp. vulgare TaxID=112509 RepID=UPI001D1A380C|nr:translation initiation factor IF-2-like isoform X1 [Hordeum vulgare subsp. vulgare]XP_044957978.1 translation initiation factor IF-2-like isoform X1 [Hordeum vulgare subsp. vulgare]